MFEFLQMPFHYTELKKNTKSSALQFDVTLLIHVFRCAHTFTHSWSQSTYTYECVYMSDD
jgi:hypothetical protein